MMIYFFSLCQLIMSPQYIKKYRNKNIGEFLSIPISLIDQSSVLDTIYLSLHFDKLRVKSVTDVRGSNHYASTIAKWTTKLNGVKCSDLDKVAEALQVNIKVFNPLAVESHSQIVLSGGTKTKSYATLLKVKSGVYKPINIGGTGEALAQPHIINNQTVARRNSATPKVRPLRNVMPNTNRRQENKYTITEVFKFQSFDGSDIDMSVIAKSIGRASITPEMIVTYLLLGDTKCRKGIPVVRNYQHEDNDEIFANVATQSFENRPLLVSQLDGNSYTFIYGSTVRINLELLVLKMSEIEDEIHIKYDNIHVNSTQPVFYLLPEHNFVPDEYSAGGMGRMGFGTWKKKSKSDPTTPKSEKNSFQNINPRESHFSYISNDGEYSRPRRHVIKATMKLDGSRTMHRVIKIAVDDIYDAEYLIEAGNYKTFKDEFPEFYEENVLRFFGTGVPNFGGAIQFEDDDGKQVMISIPTSKLYEKRRYFVTEFNPAYFTMRIFTDVMGIIYSNTNIQLDSYFTALEGILETAHEANRICSFTHGDMHWDNVFIDTDRDGKPVLFDFDFSSFGPKVAEKVMYGYQNTYLKTEYKTDSFEMKYTWYLDAIRLILSGPFWPSLLKNDGKANFLTNEAIDSYSAIVKTTDDPLTIEVKYLIETVHDMIPKNSEQYRKQWHMLMWNGERLDKDVKSLLNQQSHSFVSAVKVTHNRKMSMFRNMEAIQNSLLTMCAH